MRRSALRSQQPLKITSLLRRLQEHLQVYFWVRVARSYWYILWLAGREKRGDESIQDDLGEEKRRKRDKGFSRQRVKGENGYFRERRRRINSVIPIASQYASRVSAFLLLHGGHHFQNSGSLVNGSWGSAWCMRAICSEKKRKIKRDPACSVPHFWRVAGYAYHPLPAPLFVRFFPSVLYLLWSVYEDNASGTRFRVQDLTSRLNHYALRLRFDVYTVFS